MNTVRFKSTLIAALAALAMTPSASHAQATNTFFQPVGATVMTDGTGNQCQSTGGGAVWQNWFVNNPGITNYQIIFDTANPPPTGSTGSMLQVQEWDGINSGTLSTFACIDGDFWGGQKVNMSQFQSIELDFRFDTSSTMTPTNSWGVTIGVNSDNNASSVPINSVGIFNTGTSVTNFDGTWHHLSIPIPSDTSALHSEGPGFTIFHNNATIGSFRYWVANIELLARTNAVPPPSVFIAKSSAGLRQFADATPSYNRQDLRTDTAPAGPGSGKEFDWVGHPGAKYSWTVSDFPGPGHAGFTMAFTLTPDPAESMTYADPDWSSTNCLWLNCQANGDGSVTAGLRCKTNQESNNSQMFNGGTGMLLTNSITVPSAIGTWSLTFADDTHVTVTAPNGTSTNVVLDAGFGNTSSYTNISFNLYTSMSGDANIGQSVTLTSFKITGVVNPVNENLTDGTLDTPGLRLQSQGYAGANTSPPNQLFVTSADSYWLSWTLPAPQYVLEAKPLLTSPTWTDYSPSPILLNGGSNVVLASTASLPNTDISFFRLEQRTNFTQLQVLLPGESPAPNTPTGKTGTPDPVALSLGGAVDVTVRAVDPNWNLITSSDLIHLTVDPPVPSPPGDTAMTNGVVVFTGPNAVFFDATGTFTITATNMSRVLPATTISVTVGP